MKMKLKEFMTNSLTRRSSKAKKKQQQQQQLQQQQQQELLKQQEKRKEAKQTVLNSEISKPLAEVPVPNFLNNNSASKNSVNRSSLTELGHNIQVNRTLVTENFEYLATQSPPSTLDKNERFYVNFNVFNSVDTGCGCYKHVTPGAVAAKRETVDYSQHPCAELLNYNLETNFNTVPGPKARTRIKTNPWLSSPRSSPANSLDSPLSCSSSSTASYSPRVTNSRKSFSSGQQTSFTSDASSESLSNNPKLSGCRRESKVSRDSAVGISEKDSSTQTPTMSGPNSLTSSRTSLHSNTTEDFETTSVNPRGLAAKAIQTIDTDTSCEMLDVVDALNDPHPPNLEHLVSFEYEETFESQMEAVLSDSGKGSREDELFSGEDTDEVDRWEEQKRNNPFSVDEADYYTKTQVFLDSADNEKVFDSVWDPMDGDTLDDSGYMERSKLESDENSDVADDDNDDSDSSDEDEVELCNDEFDFTSQENGKNFIHDYLDKNGISPGPRQSPKPYQWYYGVNEKVKETNMDTHTPNGLAPKNDETMKNNLDVKNNMLKTGDGESDPISVGSEIMYKNVYADIENRSDTFLLNNNVYNNMTSDDDKENHESGGNSSVMMESGRTLGQVRVSLEEKVKRLRREKLIVDEKIRQAQEEERIRFQEKLKFQKQITLHRKQILLRTLADLKRKLENHSTRLQSSYNNVLFMQKCITRGKRMRVSEKVVNGDNSREAPF